MRIIDIFRIAFSTFRNNKMRTFLTIFGVSIGIGAIVFLFSFGYGLQKITIGEISAIKALTTYNVTTGSSSIINLDNENIGKIKKIGNVVSVDPNLSISGQVSFNKTKTDLIASAVPAEYVDLESPRMETGNLLKDDKSSEIVITSSIVKAFNSKNEEILNKPVHLAVYIPNPSDKNKPTLVEKDFTVVGVIRDASASYSYIPINSIEIPGNVSFTALKVKIDNSDNMSRVKEELTKMGFQSSSVGERVSQMNRVFDIAKLILLILGAIALLVASIGMFNTLTISLLERTKDIGIMKALGATDREIYLVFLVESTLISSVGGLAGIFIAFITGTALNIAVSILAKNAGGDPMKLVVVPAWFALFVLVFSMAVGILTGLYPSRRAAKLNPLDALRYE